ncbi:MAG: substrate-binding periplasmic protein [Bryobacteraceae bacterium]
MKTRFHLAIRLLQARIREVHFLVFIPLLVNLGCANLPRDPERTTERVEREHKIRVGLAENPPWVIRTGGEPKGLEVTLVRDFAHTLNADPLWFWGNEQTRMDALEHFELDLVISGLDATTPWSKSVGLTRPYFDEQFTVGLPMGVRAPERLRGLRVAVPEGDALASHVQSKGAVPVRTANMTGFNGPVAAPVWALEKLGFSRTNFLVFEKKHVFATPPGENGWLKKIGDYLQDHEPNLPTLLPREAQP